MICASETMVTHVTICQGHGEVLCVGLVAYSLPRETG